MAVAANHLDYVAPHGNAFQLKRFRGGLNLDWVGFNLDFADFKLGISASRANWLCTYLKQALADNCVVLREFSEALGRLGFASQVLTWCKPFLAPLFSWAAVARRRPSPGERLKLPLLVRLSLVYLEEQLTKGERVVSSSLPPEPLGEILRTDAKFEDGKVVLAGWELGPTKLFSEARWFSLSLTESQVPWLFRSGKSSWASTSAEMLASVAAIAVDIHCSWRGQPGNVTPRQEDFEYEASTDAGTYAVGGFAITAEALPRLALAPS